MALSVAQLERRARYVMGVVAVVGAAGLAAGKLGWISTAPVYQHGAWYLVGGNEDFVITSEYADEATCRQKESATSVCRSGKALIEQEARGKQLQHT